MPFICKSAYSAVSTWKNISSYQVFEKFVKTLNVCNDSVERAIKLISDYSNSLTIDNEEREKIMQLVQAYRQKLKILLKKHCLNKKRYHESANSDSLMSA